MPCPKDGTKVTPHRGVSQVLAGGVQEETQDGGGPSHCGPLHHSSSSASVSLHLQTRRLIFTGQDSCGTRVSTATPNASSLGPSSLPCFVPRDQQPQLQPRKQGHLDLQAHHRLQEERSTTALCSPAGPPSFLTAHYSCDEGSLSPWKEGVCVCVLPYILVTALTSL